MIIPTIPKLRPVDYDRAAVVTVIAATLAAGILYLLAAGGAI